jgi:hypothetical protein
MKKSIKISSLIVLTLITVLFQGCVKDTCKHTYTYSRFTPVFKTIEEVRANIKSSAPKAIQSPGKLFIIGNYIFLNEIDKGIHVINNANPANPQNVAFINIPGNVDIAVKGNILYADLYTDLVALDISNPLNVVKTSIVDNVFPHRSYGGGFYYAQGQIITEWLRSDTTIVEDCSQSGNQIWASDGGRVFTLQSNVGSTASNSFAGGSPTGIAGSMSRFALVNNVLYTVGDSELKVINVTNTALPVVNNTVQLPWGIETIYPFKDKLFIGGNSGMYMYNITNPYSPVQLGSFTHARVCDPVIADDDYAYVTLRNGTQCAGFLNELNVVDISNLMAPVLQKKYDLFNPHGLSKDGNLLFVCDGKDGIKVFDATDRQNLVLKKQIPNLDTYDVIAYNGLMIVVAADGLYQYDYTNANNIVLVSKILINQ